MVNQHNHPFFSYTAISRFKFNYFIFLGDLRYEKMFYLLPEDIYKGKTLLNHSTNQKVSEFSKLFTTDKTAIFHVII